MGNTSAMKRGWHWNESSSSLDAMAEGRDIFQLYSTSTSQRLKISGDSAGYGRLEVHQGDLKIHNHAISSGYNTEFKCEFTNTTGTLYANHRTTQITADYTGTAASMIGTFNSFYVASGYTVSSASASYFATVGQSFLNQGTLNGAGINCGCMWSLIDSGGTWTAISALRNLWLDTHLASTISAGNFYMLDITVNGTTNPTALIHTYSGSSSNPIFNFEGNEAAAVSLTGTPGAVTGATGWIKVSMRGTTRYIALASSVS